LCRGRNLLPVRRAHDTVTRKHGVQQLREEGRKGRGTQSRGRKMTMSVRFGHGSPFKGKKRSLTIPDAYEAGQSSREGRSFPNRKKEFVRGDRKRERPRGPQEE